MPTDLFEQAGVAPRDVLAENPPERGVAGSIADTFTGADRETDATRDLPELPFSGLLSGEDKATVLKVAPVLLTTIDPKEQAKILSENFDSIGIQQDEKGNLIAGNNRTGAKAMLNKPGMSGQDVLQGAALAAEFTPAARLAGGGGSLIKKMGAVGLGSGATETANQTAQAATGGDFDKGDVGVATAGGAAFEGIFQGLAHLFPVFRKAVTATGRIPEKVRQRFEVEWRNAGRTEELTDDIIRQELGLADAPIAGEREFGVQLTRGQRTGNQSQLRREDDFLAGRSGENAQNTMLGQREMVQGQVNDAGERVQRGLGGDIRNQADAGEVIKDSVRESERLASEAVDQAYQSVGDAALQPEGFVDLFKEMKTAIKGIEFPVTAETKGTRGLLNQINAAQKFFRRSGVKLKPQHVKRLEQIRRSINAHIDTAANNTDRRNMVTMKNAFDDYLDKAVMNALFEGDEQALSSLKASRKLFADYAKRFRANPQRTATGSIPDRGGKLIEEIIAADPTDNQVVNALFGATRFGKDASEKLIKRFRLATNEEGWNAIRQAGFRRLMKFDRNGDILPKQTYRNIQDAMEKQRGLMEELYSPDEISLIQRFGAHINRTRPEIVRGSANPSGTANALREIAQRLTRTMGVATGNPLFLITGTNVRSGAGAREAVRPFTIEARPAMVGAGTAATVQGNQ